MLLIFKVQSPSLASTAETIAKLRKLLLSFRLSLDSEEINELQSETFCFLNQALKDLGAPLDSATGLLERLNSYFTNDTFDSPESLLQEAELLVDMKELLSHWEAVCTDLSNRKQIRVELEAKDIMVEIRTYVHRSFLYIHICIYKYAPVFCFSRTILLSSMSSTP